MNMRNGKKEKGRNKRTEGKIGREGGEKKKNGRKGKGKIKEENGEKSKGKDKDDKENNEIEEKQE